MLQIKAPSARLGQHSRACSALVAARPCRPCSGPRPISHVAAAFNLGKLFGLGSAARTNKRNQPGSEERDELLDLLLESQLGGTPDAERAAELVEVLASTPTPFDEALLSGGPWQVLYTSGSPQLWKATWQAGKQFNSKNRASQDFNPSGRLAVNKAEYLGGKVFVTASGTYEPQGDCLRTPQTIQANIERGSLHLFGLDVPLPIRGSGTFEVMWLDDTLRLFRSRSLGGDAYAVQVRQDRLPGLLEDAQERLL